METPPKEASLALTPIVSGPYGVILAILVLILIYVLYAVVFTTGGRREPTYERRYGAPAPSAAFRSSSARRDDTLELQRLRTELSDARRQVAQLESAATDAKMELRFAQENLDKARAAGGGGSTLAQEENRMRNAMLLQKCRDSVQSGTAAIRDLRGRNAELYEETKALSAQLKSAKADVLENEKIASDCQQRSRSSSKKKKKAPPPLPS